MEYNKNNLIAGMVYKNEIGEKFLALGYVVKKCTVGEPGEPVLKIAHVLRNDESDKPLLDDFEILHISNYTGAAPLYATFEYVNYEKFLDVLESNELGWVANNELVNSIYEAYSIFARKYNVFGGSAELFDMIDALPKLIYVASISLALNAYITIALRYPDLAKTASKYLPLLSTAPDYNTYGLDSRFAIDLVEDKFVDWELVHDLEETGCTYLRDGRYLFIDFFEVSEYSRNIYGEDLDTAIQDVINDAMRANIIPTDNN